MPKGCLSRASRSAERRSVPRPLPTARPRTVNSRRCFSTLLILLFVVLPLSAWTQTPPSPPAKAWYVRPAALCGLSTPLLQARTPLEVYGKYVLQVGADCSHAAGAGVILTFALAPCTPTISQSGSSGGYEFFASTCDISATYNPGPGYVARWTGTPSAFACPVGMAFNPVGQPPCLAIRDQTQKPSCPLCAVGASPADDPSVGNPIFPGTGNKRQEETDYIGSGTLPLAFRRIYNSAPQFGQSQLGQSWKFSYAQSITYSPGWGAGPVATINRPEGSYSFVWNGSVWVGDTDVNYKLSGAYGSFSVTTPDGREIESYGANNNLSQVTTASGTLKYSLTYSTASTPSSVAPASALLIQVSDAFGHALNLTYDSLSRLATMSDPNGGLYQYGYDANSNLTSVTYPDGRSRHYIYDESSLTSGADLPNALTGIVDENNSRYASFGYSPTGLATLTEHAGGADHYLVNYGTAPIIISTIVYTGSNPDYILEAYQPPSGVTVTDGLGTTRNYGFTAAVGSIKATGIDQPCNASCTPVPQSQGFDANGNVTSTIDFNGSLTCSTYDLTRNLESSRTEGLTGTNCPGTATARTRTITTTWDPSFRLPKVISVYAGTASGTPLRTTTYSYDASGNVLTKKVTDPVASTSRTWTYTYDGYGRVLTADGPRTDASDVTTYTYYTCTTGSECGQVHTVTNALSQTTTYNTYNVYAQPLTITDPNGVLTTLTYDARQRLTSRQVGSETTSFTYWLTGLLKQVVVADGSYLLYAYDAAHRLTQISDALGNAIDYTLDAMGNRTAENLYDPSNTLHRTHTRVFNTLSQLFKDVNAAGTAAVTTTFGYDPNGNQTSMAAPLARNTTDAYDELNRLKQITDPANGITQFGYDANDNLTSVNDPRGLATVYSYSGFGDLATQTGPDTGTTKNTYDSAGNLATSTDARGAMSTYTYDTLNRVTSIAYNQGGTADQTIAFTYDAGASGKGQLTGASDANHSLSWTYDALGRVTGKSQTVGGVTRSVAYTYTNGNLTSLTTPSGQTVSYGYNANHQVTSVTVNGTTVLNSVVYEPLGPVSGWAWGNGTTTTRTYDTDGKIAQIVSAGTKVYSYDDAFRITGISDTSTGSANWTYGYDALDRITSGTSPSVTRGWTYDANGNRLTETGTAASTYSIAPTNNRITSISGALARAYGYDAAGNMTSYATVAATYNDAGRLQTLTQGGTTETALYNALGQRIEKTGGTAGTVQFSYDEAGHLLGEYDGSGNLIEETVWLGDIPVTTLRPNGANVSIYYVHSDQLNSPRQVTRPSDNAQMWTWSSDPFGTDAANANPSGVGTFVYNLRFAGQVFDGQAGLHQNGFRDYDPATGRYTESDPIGLNGGTNTYSYVGSKPIAATDSKGLLEQCRAGLEVLGGNALGLLHHEFLCWKDETGARVCRGYGRDASSSVIDAILDRVGGKVLKDDENKSAPAASCGTDDRNQCMDTCASKEWDKLEKNTPQYGLIQGSSCQSVTQSILQTCSARCHAPPPPPPLGPDVGDPEFPNQLVAP
jgi:RHS repeat-associated protein